MVPVVLIVRVCYRQAGARDCCGQSLASRWEHGACQSLLLARTLSVFNNPTAGIAGASVASLFLHFVTAAAPPSTGTRWWQDYGRLQVRGPCNCGARCVPSGGTFVRVLFAGICRARWGRAGARADSHFLWVSTAGWLLLLFGVELGERRHR